MNHVVEAGLLGQQLNAEDYKHPVNNNSKNEEMVKVALLMGISDRVLRIRKGRIQKGVFKSDDLMIFSEYVFAELCLLFI